jgi:hypothetical protein
MRYFTLRPAFNPKWEDSMSSWPQPETSAPVGEGARGLAKASLICGICGPLALIILGPVALGLGIAARSKMRTTNNFDGGGMATAGIILGSIETVIALIAVFLAIAMRS